MLRVRRHYSAYAWVGWLWKRLKLLRLHWAFRWLWMRFVAIYERSDDGGKTWRRI